MLWLVLLCGIFFLIMIFSSIAGSVGDSDYTDLINSIGKSTAYLFFLFFSYWLGERMYVSKTTILIVSVFIFLIGMCIDVVIVLNNMEYVGYLSFIISIVCLFITCFILSIISAVRLDIDLNEISPEITSETYLIKECSIEIDDEIVVNYVSLDNESQIFFDNVKISKDVDIGERDKNIAFYISNENKVIVEREYKEIYKNSFFNISSEKFTYKFYLNEDILTDEIIKEVNDFWNNLSEQQE